MTAIIQFRLPLIEGRPTPKTFPVKTDDYYDERGRRVSVPGQVGRVDGWHYDYPQRQVVVRVEVETG